MNLEPVDNGAAQGRVVVDEGDRHELAAADEGRHEVRAGLTRPVDHDAVAGGVTRLQQPTYRQAAADDVHDCEEPKGRPGANGVRPIVDPRDAQQQRDRQRA